MVKTGCGLMGKTEEIICACALHPCSDIVAVLENVLIGWVIGF